MSANAVRQFIAYVEAAGSARRLAAKCRQEAQRDPRDANYQLSEASRHKTRARGYLLHASFIPGVPLP